jgi:hypothetical protein
MLAVANFFSRPVAVPADMLPDLDSAQLLVVTRPGVSGATLQPWESRVHLVG